MGEIMGNLKTLKEITWDLMQDTKLRHPARIQLQIRQEAIKWIKKLENPVAWAPHYPESLMSYELNADTQKGMIMWIKHFFGISEEDLK